MTTLVMEKQQTIDLLRCGDSKAWEDIVLEYQAPLSRYLYNMVRDKELARDLTQDTFIEAYRGISNTKGELKFKSWLYRIATNNAIQVLRRRKIISWTAWTEEKHDREDTENIEDDFAQRELVRDVLDRLPERYKAVLLLHDYQGFKCAEIGDLLKISLDATKKRLARGRGMFRETYQRLGGRVEK
jgi:RNA polymerase sigma-70 factor (ECF subfamily)